MDVSPGEASPLLIYSGAEAKLYKDEFLGKPALLKHRLPKAYRHKQLDRKLTYQRLTQESRNLLRCRKAGVDAPILYHVAPDEGYMYMEWIDGISVKKFLDTQPIEATFGLGMCIGDLVGRLHNAELVHGDLTTSNLMIRYPLAQFTNPLFNALLDNTSRESCHSGDPLLTVEDSADATLMSAGEAPRFHLCIIDLGLSYTSSLLEDKAVDLYLLEKAINSIHPKHLYLVEELLTSYSKANKTGVLVMQRLHDVRQRGRKRSMIG